MSGYKGPMSYSATPGALGGAGRVHGTPITITQRDTSRVSDYATGCLQCTHGRAMHVSNSFESFDYVCTDLDYTVP